MEIQTFLPRYFIQPVTPQDGEKAVAHFLGDVFQALVVDAGDLDGFALDFPSQLFGGETGVFAEVFDGMVAVEKEVEHFDDSRKNRISL